MTNGKEYGLALFELALSKNCRDEVSEGLKTVREVFINTPELEQFLLSPFVTKSERIECINDAFNGRVHEYVVSLMCVLTERGQVRFFDECADEYDALYRESVKNSQAVVYSAVELTDEEKKRLESLLEKRSGTTVETEYKIDESLIGGIVVQTQGVRLDGSLKHRLLKIKETIEQ